MAENRDLTQRFRRLIRQSGPLSVARYMGEANAQYYATRDPLGAAGDFVTAPEISQLFGEMIGLWCADLWQRAGRPERVAYVELGPGRGTLAKDAVRVMQRFDLRPEIHFVEGSPALRSLQERAFSEAHFHDGLDTLPQDMPILLIANEFFDALPIRQLVKTAQGWRERQIGLSGENFLFVGGDQPMDSAVPPDRRDAENEAIIETCPAAVAWVREIAHRLHSQNGAALLIDYGYLAPQTGSTLQAVRDHNKTDPLKAPGTADLTALVDFSALSEAVRNSGTQTDQKGAETVHKGVEAVSITTQGAFLERLGITARAQALARSDPAQTDAIASAHRRLVHPDAMGDLFKVMALVGPDWPEPSGFA